MAYRIVQFILELYSLDEVQRFLRDCRGKIIYNWEVEKAERVPAIKSIHSFQVTGLLFKHRTGLERIKIAYIFLQVIGSDSRCPVGVAFEPSTVCPPFVQRDSSL